MPRLDKTLADYVAIAISPVLIMLMVGSLLHFIVSVTYSGAYEMRMNWILSCFTVAIVLIARISMEEGPERALMYGLALAGATGIAVSYLANVVFLPFVILGLAWWAAHKITWDCTLIDETQDSSGHGLLQLARFGRKKAETVDSTVEETADGATADDAANGSANKAANDAAADKDEDNSSEPEGVTERVGRMRDEAHPRREVSGKMHAPGVWILYFSLAALPLFGLGQMFIPVADVARRQAAFSLFCWYVGSGLGLLVTTSFLGLRRYLRQRGVAMPVEMAGAWLALGAVLILSILFIAALVPRPAAEYEISQFPLKFTTPDRESSRHALGRDGAHQNRPEDEPQVTDEQRQEGPTGSETKETPEQPPSETGEPARQEPGQGDDARPKSEPSDPSQDPGREQPRTEHPSQATDPAAPRESGQEEKVESNEPIPVEQIEEQPRQDNRPHPDPKSSEPSEPSEPTESPESDRRESGASRGASQTDRREQSRQDDRASDRSDSTTQPPPAPRQPPFQLPRVSTSLGGFFKLLLYAIVCGVVGYFLWKSRAKVAAGLRQFLQELREFWASLFGGKTKRDEQTAESMPQLPRFRPFSDYQDPFASGIASRYPPEEVVRYTFEAVEAWARENGLARHEDQTPGEFALRIAEQDESLATGVQNLAGLYACVAYGPGRIKPNSIAPLAQLWRELKRPVAASPVSNNN